MGYRSALVRRWTRRDRLAIIVIAVTVAFFTGTTLVVSAAAAHTSQLAAEFGPLGYVTMDESTTTLPVAALADGGTYVGIPATNGSVETTRATWPAADTVTHGRSSASRTVTLVGAEGRVTTSVGPRPRGQSLVPADWYSGPPHHTAQLGQTGQVGVRPSTDLTTSTGAPLRGALAFFVLGTQSVLALLRLLTVGAAVLVAVTVYSVVRMTVRDRHETITVLRATGGRPRDIALPFVVRGALLTLVGVLLGYAIGVVVPNAAINAAVFAGLPVSLAARVTIPTLTTLLPGYAAVLAAGAGAATLAVRPALSGAPLADTASSWHRDWLPVGLRPRLLGWRALVPAVSALTVFVTLTVLLASVGGALAPVFAPTGATVTEPDAAHPVASTVPAAYADVLDTTGVATSPEILLFSVVRGTPFLSRGANYDAFANVTDARLVAGRAPDGRQEAVVGDDLAETLDVAVGDTLVLGGSTRAAFTRVEVVGRFEGSGLTDDQMVVSLPTARHLSGKSDGAVQFIRLSRAPTSGTTTPGLHVVSLTSPSTVAPGEPVSIRARVVNLATTKRTTHLQMLAGADTASRRVTLDAFASTTVTFKTSFTTPGTRDVRVGNTTTTLQVANESALQVSPLPDRAPPNSTLVVRATTAAGDPVRNASITLGHHRATTGRNGTAAVDVPSSGEYTLTVETATATATQPLTVATNASTQLLTSVRVAPTQPSVLTRPTVTVDITNPWNTSRAQNLRVTPPGANATVDLRPGASVQRTYQLSRQAPGAHSITVRAGGERLAAESYRVTGDDRLVSALASRAGESQGTGIGRAVQTTFGNLQVLLGTFVALGCLVTVGSVTAGFAYAVRARKETIGVYRATGARPRAILWWVVTDALRVGGIAMALALASGYAVALALTTTGYTTVFGIRIAPRADPLALAALALGGLTVVVVGAVVAALPLARAPPRALLTEGDGT